MKTSLLVPVGVAALSGLLALLTGTSLAASFSLVGSPPRSLTPAALTAAQRTVTWGRTAAGKKTLIFEQQTIRLVVVTGPGNDMLSYRINTLRNPTLIVCRGAVLKVLFANVDDDMFHDLRFGPARMTYPNVMEPALKTSAGTLPLPHESGAVIHAEELTLHVPALPGSYAYFCTVRGHAQGGMAGRIIVR